MKATKLKKEAQNTAYCGRSTRVDTMVAIEFAASCRPLRKSNSKATAIKPISSGRASTMPSMRAAPRSNVVDHDAVDLVGDVVEAIDHRLEMIIDLVADHIGPGIAVPVPPVKLLAAGVVDLGCLTLELR